MGHRSSDCPLRKQVHLLDNYNDTNEDEETSRKEETELIIGDEGKPFTYVIQKILLSPKNPNHTQKHSLFRTQCTILNEVCGVIVDSGSCENIILVKAL